MRKLNDSDLLQCRFVSDLFEYSTKNKDSSSKVFIKAYVYSSAERRISSPSFFIDSLDIPSAYDLVKKEKDITSGNNIYPPYIMAWIGYIMEYFQRSTSIPLTALYKRIKPEELYLLYEPYHSLDNDLVVKRLAESKNINLELHQPEILKRIK